MSIYRRRDLKVRCCLSFSSSANDAKLIYAYYLKIPFPNIGNRERRVAMGYKQ